MKLRHYKLRRPARCPSGSRSKQTQKLRADQRSGNVSIADLLAVIPALIDSDFEPTRYDIRLRPADLS
jgi:hypothetical protein